MRPTAIRRTAVAATVMSLALFTAACGSDNDDKDSGKAAGSSAQPSEKAADKGADQPAAKVLSAAELEKVSLEQGDVKGHKVTKAGAVDKIDAKDVTADKESCDVLADLLMGAKAGSPAASTQRKVISEPKADAAKDSEDLDEAFGAAFDITTTMTTLASYEGKGAEETLASLRTAATDCAGGFTITAAGDKQKVTKVQEEKVEGGEEAGAWTVTIKADDGNMALKLVALRQGSTLASFSAMNLAAAGTGKDFDLPTAVVDAQAKKLA